MAVSLCMYVFMCQKFQKLEIQHILKDVIYLRIKTLIQKFEGYGQLWLQYIAETIEGPLTQATKKLPSDVQAILPKSINNLTF